MRIWIRNLFILLAFTMPLTAIADVPRVGFVNVDHLLNESPQAREADAALEAALTPAQQELMQKQEAFQELQQELERDGLVMSEDERAEVQQQLRQLQQELMQGEQVFRQQVEQQRNIALGQVEQAVMRAVSELADEKGLDLVVSQGVLYAGDGVNITDEVLQRMMAHHEADN